MIELYILEQANNIAGEIRKINEVLTGTNTLSGGLLCDILDEVTDIVKAYLNPIFDTNITGDDLNNIASEIMYADKKEIGDIVKKYYNGFVKK